MVTLLAALLAALLVGTPARAADTGHISGTVTGPSGTALPGITVTLYVPSSAAGYWDTVRSTTTGSDGTYDLSGLAAGTYRVGFSDLDNTYAPEFWDDAIDVESASDIAVPEGGTASHRDARLAPGGQISGHVTDPRGAAIGCCHAQVVVYRYSSHHQYWQYVTTAFTDATGSYVARGLAAATYRVGFSDGADGYLPQYWNDKPDVLSADDIVVTAGATATGQDAQLDQGGHVNGTVTAAGGVALSGIGVQAYRQDGITWTFAQYATTDTSGHYDLGSLLDGTYRLSFTDGTGTYLDEYWDDAPTSDQATTVVIAAAGTVSGISPVLAKAGRILGTVTAPGGTGAGGETVQAYHLTSGGAWQYAAGATTSSDGSYALGRLRTGTYRLGFSDGSGHLAREYYNDVTTLAAATDITVTAGADTVGKNARLALASHITGTVTGSGQVAAAGVQVTAYYFSTAGSYDTAATATTDSSGRYDLGGLAAGSYAICFNDLQSRYFQECWRDKDYSWQADPVAVGAGSTTSSIDEELTPGGRITGTVTGADGLSPYSVIATAYQKNGQGWYGAASGYVQGDGTYLVGPLKPGTYRVGFSDYRHHYAPQFWNGKPSLEKAQSITVTGSGAVSGIDARLLVGSHITGRVTGTAGQPVSGALVTAYTYDRSQRYWRSVVAVSTGATGDYDLSGLGVGSYRVGFADPSGQHLREYWNDQRSVEKATDIKVGARATVSGKDAVLADAAHVTGVVTGSDGTPLSGAYVNGYHEDPATHETDGYASTSTDADGHYDLAGLQGGTWRLQFGDPAGHLGEYWNDKPTLDSATPISVATGTTVTGKDAQLTAASHITGTVTDAAGQRLSGVWVYAYVYDAQYHEWEEVSSALTDSAGAYDVGRLAAGTYRLWFLGDADHAQQYWKNKVSLDQADDIKVGRQAVASGKNVRLAPAGHVTGTVTGPAGQAVAGVYVAAYTLDPATQTWTAFWGATSDAQGHYDIGTLPADTYRIGFRDYGAPGSSVVRYAREFWNGKPDVQSADDLPVATGATVSGTDEQLDPTATISGLTTDADGHGVDCQITVFRRTDAGTYEPYADGYTSTVQGGYTVAGLPPGTYRLEFDPDRQDLATEYYHNVSTLAGATDVVIAKTGQQIKRTNAVLTAGAAAAPATVASPGGGGPLVPTIQGNPQVGWTLVADAGPPVVGEQLRYQWQVGGVDVLGATASTYSVAPQDAGQPVTVRVLAGGHGSLASVTSPATLPVRSASGSDSDLDQHDGPITPRTPALDHAGVGP